MNTLLIGICADMDWFDDYKNLERIHIYGTAYIFTD